MNQIKIQVNHPRHYNGGEVEVIDLIENWGLGFCLGNAVKYICRAGKKGGEKECKVDLEKAIWYLDRAIEKQEHIFVLGSLNAPKFPDMNIRGIRNVALYAIYDFSLYADRAHLEIAKFALKKELEKYEEEN